MHLAARFCAKEAVAKALGLTVWSFRDVEVVATDAAPRCAQRARARRAEGHAVSDERISLTRSTRPTAARGRRGGRAQSDAAQPWLDPLYEADEMRAVDAWAIEEQGVPSLDLMERAGEGLARVTAEAARRGTARVVVGKGNNGGDGLVAARLLRDDGHEVDVLAVAPLDELRGDALANLERLPGEPRAVRPGRPRRLGRYRRRAARHRLRGHAARARGRSDRGDQRAGRPVVACDVPSGVDASPGRSRARRCGAPRLRSTAPSRPSVEPGRATPARSAWCRSASPGRTGAEAAGLITESPRPRSAPPARGGSSSVGGSRGGRRRGAHRRAVDGGATTSAGGRYIQLARAPRLIRAAAARGDDSRFPTRTAATAGGVDVLLEMAERAGCVVLGPGLGRSEGRIEFAAGRRRPRRCWWTRTG